MTNEEKEKELLLKDLSSRLPYGVKVSCIDDFNHDWYNLELVDVKDNEVYISTYEPCYSNKYTNIESIRPYLFPLSSMTEKQAEDLFKTFGLVLPSTEEDYIKINEVTGITFFLLQGFDVETHLDKLVDWLNKNYFDYRGLIPIGLAIDATGLNIY